METIDLKEFLSLFEILLYAAIPSLQFGLENLLSGRINCSNELLTFPKKIQKQFSYVRSLERQFTMHVWKFLRCMICRIWALLLLWSSFIVSQEGLVTVKFITFDKTILIWRWLFQFLPCSVNSWNMRFKLEHPQTLHK